MRCMNVSQIKEYTSLELQTTKHMKNNQKKLHIRNFLYENGLDVPPTLPSLQGNRVEKINIRQGAFLQYYIKLLLVYIYQAANGILLYLKDLVNKSEKLHRISKIFEKAKPVKYINDWYENEEYNFVKYIPKEETTIREIASEVLNSIKVLQKIHFKITA